MSLRALLNGRPLSRVELAGARVGIDVAAWCVQAREERPDGDDAALLVALGSRAERVRALGARLAFALDGPATPPRVGALTEDEDDAVGARRPRRKARAPVDPYADPPPPPDALDELRAADSVLKRPRERRASDALVAAAARVLERAGAEPLPGDGAAEATLAAMAADGGLAFVSGDDGPLVFGAPAVLRELDASPAAGGALGRLRPTPAGPRFVPATVVVLGDALSELGLDRRAFVRLAILCGTPFNAGVRGVGPRSALRLVRAHEDLDSVFEAAGVEAPFDVRALEALFG